MLRIKNNPCNPGSDLTGSQITGDNSGKNKKKEKDKGKTTNH